MSMKCKYAIKALIQLGSHYDDGYVLTSTISREENIPKKFLEQILLELKHAGFVGSKQGYGGGYYLKTKPRDISVADVYRLFDGAIALVPCVSLNFYEKCEDCKSEKTCLMREEFIKIREGARLIMSKTTIQSFLNQENKNK